MEVHNSASAKYEQVTQLSVTAHMVDETHSAIPHSKFPNDYILGEFNSSARDSRTAFAISHKSLWETAANELGGDVSKRAAQNSEALYRANTIESSINTVPEVRAIYGVEWSSRFSPMSASLLSQAQRLQTNSQIPPKDDTVKD